MKDKPKLSIDGRYYNIISMDWTDHKGTDDEILSAKVTFECIIPLQDLIEIWQQQFRDR
jgi:hypothetical protein